MKAMKTTLLILSLVMLHSCSNGDDTFTPTLPPITQTGANTFGCYIDGKLLTPRDGTGSTLGPDPGMRFIGSSFSTFNDIKVRDFVSGTGGLLDIHFNNLSESGEGSFTISESNCQDGIDANPTFNIRCRLWDPNQELFKWYCSTENAGTLNITRYDFENRILSGTFDCTVQNRDNPNDIIEITQGRFDIKWDTLQDKEFP